MGGQFEAPIPACTADPNTSPPTGCVTFPGETIPSSGGDGWTITVNAVFSFNSSVSGDVSGTLPNDDAAGGGTY
jgi:hypothetical protein